MTENELELIRIIWESEDPQAVALYFFSLFEDYLRTNVPALKNIPADPPESV